jgi:tRNA U34 5-carboxymethylaminomethyl modifying enzyme MnmG/GidA
MCNARIEKNTYLSDLVLIDNGIKSLKSLNSVNEFTVKSELLQIDENVYKKEYNELVISNENIKLIKQSLQKTEIIVEEVKEENIDKNYMRLNESEEVKEEKNISIDSSL